MPIHTAYRVARVCTVDSRTSRTVPAAEPVVISARPPWRSSHRPTGTAAAAPARVAAVSAPVIAVVEACRSWASGASSTANG